MRSMFPSQWAMRPQIPSRVDAGDLGGQDGDEKPITFPGVLGLQQGIDRHVHGVSR